MGAQATREWTSSGHKPIAFRGLFQDPDYANSTLFLQEDAQTSVTELVAEASDSIFGSGIDALKQIDNLIRHRTPYMRDLFSDDEIQKAKPPIFTRTADDILQSGYVSGCTECAVLFATLARTKGIPSIVVDSADMKWIERGMPLDKVGGHFLVEVNLNSQWLLVDSAAGKLYKNYDPKNPCLPEGSAYRGSRFFAFAKGLSPIDIGITDTIHNHLQHTAFSEGKTTYAPPRCEMLDLRRGMGNSPNLSTFSKRTLSLDHLAPSGDFVTSITASEAAELRAKKLSENRLQAGITSSTRERLGLWMKKAKSRSQRFRLG